MQLHLFGASDLPNMDGFFGKSDPYCIVTMAAEKIMTTKVLSGQLNPMWNKSTTFQWDGMNDIIFTIKDSDFFTADDWIAQYIMSKEDALQGFNGMKKLTINPKYDRGGINSPQIIVKIGEPWDTCCGGCSIM